MIHTLDDCDLKGSARHDHRKPTLLFDSGPGVELYSGCTEGSCYANDHEPLDLQH